MMVIFLLEFELRLRVSCCVSGRIICWKYGLLLFYILDHEPYVGSTREQFDRGTLIIF